VTPSATIVITTKNRKDELRNALASSFAQTAPVEVLVIDDGSTDGTVDLVRTEFPAVRLVRHEISTGYIVARNEAARLATAPVVVSIDDDSTFPSPHTVEQSLKEFDHPRIGAVAIPFINVKQDNRVHQRAPDTAGVYVTDRYIGTAHAVRRDLFLALGGYREHFVHQGEEGDYCIRMLAAGYVVRLGSADPIHHFESPRRSFERMDYYGKRNLILFAWGNVPLLALPVHLGVSSFKGVLHLIRTGRLRNGLRGMATGYGHILVGSADRDAVPMGTYKLFRRLKRSGPIKLEVIERRLTPAWSLWAVPERKDFG
jgi:GT2 family glycosyltransferase